MARGASGRKSHLIPLTLALSQPEEGTSEPTNFTPLRGGLAWLLFCFVLLLPLVGDADEERGNPAARLLPGDSASEHWEFTARFESGHLLFVEFLITNIGLGERNAAAAWHLVTPEGKTHRTTNGRRASNWTLAADHLRLEIGASVLDLHSPAYQLHLDKKSMRVNVRFRPDAQAVWSEQGVPTGYALDLLAAAVPVEGTVWVRGMKTPLTVKGTVAATHSWMNEAGASLIRRRIEFFSLQEQHPFYGVEFTAPNGTQARWVMVKPNGGERYDSCLVEWTLAGRAKEPRERGYEVPATIRMKNAQLEGNAQLERVLLRADPFIDIPRPFRLVVSLALDLRPRRVWALAPYELSFSPTTEKQSVLQLQGSGVTAVTFLNPMPPQP
jgi:hypothetical protein